MLKFTEAATDKIKEVIAEAGEGCAGLRIRALRLGRYTYRYQLHLVRREDLHEDDVTVEGDGFTAYLDPQSAEWMQGSTIDFLTVGGQTGFQIDNPAANPQWEDPLAQKVQTVLDHRVLPAIAQHGGWVELDHVEGDTAYVVLGGGCVGCASANETLKMGIEAILVKEIPEIKRVVDQTDHSAGENPYYTG